MKRFSTIAKRVTTIVVAMVMAFSLVPSQALADGGRIVTLGANLSADQRQTVLKFFGLTEADLSNLTVITVNNQDERAHFSSSIDSSIIGTETYSCSYIQPTNSGGILVKSANLTYVTENMLYNALQTAGVKNCNLVVTAPFPVSGTGALTGVFMAYEAKGQKLDDAKEQAASDELVTTAQLSETYGGEVAEVLSDVKSQVVSKTEDMTDDQIRDSIRSAAQNKGISLSDEDINTILDLIKRLRGLNYDPDSFAATLSDFEQKIKELGNQAQQAGGIFESIGNFFKGIADWFMGLFGGGKTPSREEVEKSAQDFFNSFDTNVINWDSAR